MAEKNRLWGAERIRGELLKLGIRVAKRTIQKYLPKDRRPSGQAWATFLKNHAQEIYVCDFTVVHDLCFRPIYLLVVMHLATRQIKHFNLTRNPSVNSRGMVTRHSRVMVTRHSRTDAYQG